MASVATVSATMVGPGTAHGLTRLTFTTAGSGVPVPSDVGAAQSAFMDFWTAIANRVVAGIVITPEIACVVRDVATGLTTAEVTGTGIPPAVLGADTSPEFVSGTGCRVDWRTGVRRGSREVRGSTFVIPMGSGQFAPNGDLTVAAVDAVQAAANAMIAAMFASGLVQVVYGRPLPETKHHGALEGITAAVTGGQVPETPAFLRRRRQ